jgi:hypothetical protein
VTDAPRAEDQVMCLDCYEPTPFEDLALDAWGVPMQRCVRCAARDSGSDCEPAWAPPRSAVDLPDIADYQEQQHG